MESAGLAIGIVGLAGLFSLCLNTINRAKDYKSFDTDSQTLNAQFEADRLRFERWGRNVGFDQGHLSADHHELLDDDRTVSAVTELLKFINELCGGVPPQIGRAKLRNDKALGPIGPHSSHSTAGVSRRRKFTWAFGGKGERTSQLELFGKSVQQLHHLVPPDREEGATRKPTGNGTQSDLDWLPDLQQFLAEKQAESRRQIHSWLVGSHHPNERYDESRNEKLAGTCDWILNRPAYQRWSSLDFPDDRAKLLWIYGPPGFGKTILCAHLVDHLSSTLNTPVAYFFFSSDHERNDPYAVVRSWVSQLASHSDAFAIIRQQWEATQDYIAPRLTVVQLLCEILHAVQGCTLIVDGIDECTKLGDHASPVVRFLEDVKKAATSTTRILIVSRDEVGIRRTLRNGHHCTLSDYRILLKDVQPDNAAYAQDIVNRKLENKTEDIKSSLSRIMTGRCEGQFLWLKMQVKSLKGSRNLAQLTRDVNKTPAELDNIYERNWNLIAGGEQDDRDRAFALLRWAAFALRPLTVGEITEAVLVNEIDNRLMLEDLPDTIDDEFIDDQILGLCSPLLEVRHKQSMSPAGHRTVHLSHFTVKQFLVYRLPSGELQTNGSLQASYEQRQSTLLARLCLCYIQSRKVWQEPTSDQTVPFQAAFRDYAAASWHVHTSSGIPLAADANTTECILEFMDEAHPCWNSWQIWFDTQDEEEKAQAAKESRPPNPAYYSLKLGQTTIAIRLIQTRGYRAGITDFNRSPLHQACLGGETEVVRAMLQAGASVMTLDITGRTPVYMASQKGYLELVQLLIEKGADIAAPNIYGGTPMNSAASEGHLELVQLLIEKGADIAAPNNDGWTPVNLAATQGHLEVVWLLINKGADIAVPNNDGWTPVNSAATQGHLEVVRLLIDKGADIAAPDKNGWTPVNSAADQGHLEVVRLLIEKGADIAVPNKNGWTPVSSAASEGHLEVMQILLQRSSIEGSRKGALDPVKLGPLSDLAGGTPLFHAARNGQLKVAELLLDTGDFLPTARDWHGTTPLFTAARNGHIEMTRILLEADVSAINDKDGFGHTLMWWALRHQDTALSDLLLSTAATACIQMIKEDPPSSTKKPPKSPLLDQWCDACTLRMGDDYYWCKECFLGTFSVCSECFDLGVSCPGKSHKLYLNDSS